MIKIVLISLIGAFLLLWGYARFLETHRLFFPLATIEFTPENAGLAYEELWLPSGDGVKLNGWFIPAENAFYTILFFHGNGGNISQRLEKAVVLNSLKVNVCLIDYRGYGRSEGCPSERGLYSDASAALQYLIREQGIAPDRIVLYGESLGSAVAVDCATRHQVKALILEGAFSCGRSMGRLLFPAVPWFFFTCRFDSLAKIGRVNVPLLFMHSIYDEVVPFSLGRKLFEQASGPKRFVEFSCGHTAAYAEEAQDYRQAISSFLAGLDDR